MKRGGYNLRRKSMGICKKSCAVIMTAALVVTTFASTGVEAAKAKGVSLSKTKLSLTVGSKKKITVKNATGKKVVSVKWTVNKAGKKVISFSKKSVSGVTVKALKKGKAIGKMSKSGFCITSHRKKQVFLKYKKFKCLFFATAVF